MKKNGTTRTFFLFSISSYVSGINVQKWAYSFLIVVLVLIITSTAGVCTDGEEGGGNWRKIYDIVMMWVNFLILAFIVVRYGKAPIMKFLRGKKEELVEEFKLIEEKKEQLEAEIEKSKEALEKTNERLEDMKKRIVSQGERKKEALIEEAKEQSILIIEDSKRKIEGRIRNAKSSLKNDLIDASIDLAEKKLPELVKKNDHDKLLNDFLKASS